MINWAGLRRGAKSLNTMLSTSGFVQMLNLLWASGVPRYGNTWFVKSDATGDTAKDGSDQNSGTSWDEAFKTIAVAVSKATAGDTIYLMGTGFDEAVTLSTTSGKGGGSSRGITIVGAGNDPDDTRWTYSTADGTCLTINVQNVTVRNIRFKPPTYTAGTPAAIKLGTSGSYARIEGNRFQGQASSYFGIYSAATGADNVKIVGNKFMYLNNVTNVSGTAVNAVQATPWNAYSGWEIVGNEFNSCVVAIDFPARCCKITDNTIAVIGNTAAAAIGTVCTTGIDLRGNGAEVGGNIVTRNTLGGLYTTALYNAAQTGTNDVWFGNFVNLTTTTAAYGLSVLIPAA